MSSSAAFWIRLAEVGYAALVGWWVGRVLFFGSYVGFLICRAIARAWLQSRLPPFDWEREGLFA